MFLGQELEETKGQLREQESKESKGLEFREEQGEEDKILVIKAEFL